MMIYWFISIIFYCILPNTHVLDFPGMYVFNSDKFFFFMYLPRRNVGDGDSYDVASSMILCNQSSYTKFYSISKL